MHIRTLIISVLVIGFVVYGYVISQRVESSPKGKTEMPIVREEAKVAGIEDINIQQDQSVELAYPSSISIQKINVEAPIEKVGLDQKERMDVPKDFGNVGWYKLGYFPGERGSVVMAGHVDRKNGDPAVFAQIKTLENGDEITVKDSQGKKLTYIVVDKQTYSYDKVPLLRVFGANDYRRLNLITCTGQFDTNSENYSNRLVVYAIQKEDLPIYTPSP